MSGAINAFAPRDPRYKVAEEKRLTGAIQQAGVHGYDDVLVEVCDLSSNGLKLKVRSDKPFQGPVVLRLQSAEASLDLSLAADIRWARAGVGDFWWAGVRLCDQIPSQTLLRLATEGVIDRRRHPRTACEIGATARWELSDGPVEVKIINRSQQGLCVFCPRGGNVGLRLRLEIEEPHGPGRALAKAIWQDKQEDGYFVGCAVETQETPGEAPNRVQTAQAADPPRKRPLLSRTTILILSGVLLALSLLPSTSITFISLLAGLAGMLAFLGLDAVERRLQKQAVEDRVSEVERRVDHHVNADFQLTAKL